jgi:hypothetical protein
MPILIEVRPQSQLRGKGVWLTLADARHQQTATMTPRIHFGHGDLLARPGGGGSRSGARSAPTSTSPNRPIPTARRRVPVIAARSWSSVDHMWQAARSRASLLGMIVSPGGAEHDFEPAQTS